MVTDLQNSAPDLAVSDLQKDAAWFSRNIKRLAALDTGCPFARRTANATGSIYG